MIPTLAPIALGTIGADMRVTDLDATYAALLGRSRDQIVGQNALDFVHPDDRHSNAAGLDSAWADRTPFAMTKRYIRGDGSVLWVRNHVACAGEGDDRRLLVTCEPLDEPLLAAPRVPVSRSPVEARWATARMLFETFGRGKALVGKAMISCPPAEILLLLYLVEAEARSVAAQSIAAQIDLPWQLTARWLSAMMREELVETERAAPLGPDSALRLSHRGQTIMEDVLSDCTGQADHPALT